MLSNQFVKFILVCLLCIALVTGLVLLVQYFVSA